MTIQPNLPIYDIDVDDQDYGCYKISIVEDPAVETLCLKFSKDESQDFKFQITDEEQHIISGIAIRADYPIYRNQDGEEFFIRFTKDNILKIVLKFMKEKNTANISLEHSTDVLNCFLFESYIINKERGICPKEFIDIEDGSWFCSVKIDNDEVWKYLKEHGTQGFSIEILGNLSQEVKLNKDNKDTKEPNPINPDVDAVNPLSFLDKHIRIKQ